MHVDYQVSVQHNLCVSRPAFVSSVEISTSIDLVVWLAKLNHRSSRSHHADNSFIICIGFITSSVLTECVHTTIIYMQFLVVKLTGIGICIYA